MGYLFGYFADVFYIVFGILALLLLALLASFLIEKKHYRERGSRLSTRVGNVFIRDTITTSDRKSKTEQIMRIKRRRGFLEQKALGFPEYEKTYVKISGCRHLNNKKYRISGK